MSNIAYAMVYPEITSCRPAPDVCRLERMVGAATLTMVTSRMAMNWPVSTIASSHPGRAAVAACAVAARPVWVGKAGDDMAGSAVLPCTEVSVMASRIARDQYR